MINFYELFYDFLSSNQFDQFENKFFLFCLLFFIFFLLFYVIYLFFLSLFYSGEIELNLNFKEIMIFIFAIISSVSFSCFGMKEIKKMKKKEFYKIAKANKLNINYEKFISEKKKLNDFCSERKLYSKYEDNFCKIETGNIVNDVFNFSEDTINKDTVNKVFNELYSTSNNKNKTKNKAVEEAIKFIKENKIQIKVNNKK